MFYRYHPDYCSFQHCIHFETEHELDKFSYECESDSLNYYFMRKQWKNITDWFLENKLVNGNDFVTEYDDYQIRFKNKNDALKFKIVWS